MQTANGAAGIINRMTSKHTNNVIFPVATKAVSRLDKQSNHGLGLRFGYTDSMPTLQL